MPSLSSCVTLTELSAQSIQVDPKTRDVRFESVVYAAAKRKCSPECKCEACSALHMQRSKDMRTKKLKAMMPGNVDQGNRQTPEEASSLKADFNLTMKKVNAKIKQVPPPKQKVGTIKPSQLMHDKGKILKGKHIGFKKLKQKLGNEKGIDNPGGLAYKIGVEKYGKKGMKKKAVGK